ncbi:DNA gyrase inhibitor YacG [Bradyrhizobium sp. AUGA SZCCT0240]|uniref:DNA gyrase inhibitor YacG n=1 Tax=unclassified Bradyrhizobium TaxID=2631580 RepID=UPI001BA5B395|nr:MULTISPECIES: DNA gyrase inhibitor YacG [unclassified Bradyrhizobium]MBR1188700.1 DNA gyrase inhibitor YacG [Bradyrhizobium sp. AUGA SZCCT0160]MBR1195013.1 DNA gyrase inhibitor YacG [Bradyrhizobium sp. AUGA SZCCT0158]MBR1242789.1 DNA gyrase inhibitor YacG [Bradyrhizobium sp. AUGA SZCCT0274]MBR1250691.1 DNA gyrase inhibitor YacG [Bradyrhizobium sp. AUGA SZCCT0169]MBR1252924.1 DNA gyrase inhibitor YacG [Bradyrhizobium sp. AUGA SZCCT0240]
MPADPPKDEAPSKPSSKPCPECGKPAENPKTLPFCSSRCRDVDLNRWLSGRYVIPGKENEGEDEE